MQSLRINAFSGSSDLRIFGDCGQVADLDRWRSLHFYRHCRETIARFSPSLNEIFQILSLTMFEKTPMDRLEQTVATEDYIPIYDHVLVGTTGINNRSLLEGENQEL